MIRVKIVILRRKDYSVRAIEQKTDICKSFVQNIYRHVLNQFIKFQIAVNNSGCYKSKSRSDRSQYSFKEKIEQIFKYVIVTAENKRKTTLKIIAKLRIKKTKEGKLLFKLKFKQIMYDRKYERESRD